MLIRQLPPQSATWVSKNGGDALWGLSEQLLAAVVDSLNLANWQRSAQGAKSPPKKPDPIPRPGVQPEGRALGGGVSVSIAEMRRRMRRRHGNRR